MGWSFWQSHAVSWIEPHPSKSFTDLGWPLCILCLIEAHPGKYTGIHWLAFKPIKKQIPLHKFELQASDPADKFKPSTKSPDWNQR